MFPPLKGRVLLGVLSKDSKDSSIDAEDTDH